jgi:hypothetical protein
MEKDNELEIPIFTTFKAIQPIFEQYEAYYRTELKKNLSKKKAINYIYTMVHLTACGFSFYFGLYIFAGLFLFFTIRNFEKNFKEIVVRVKDCSFLKSLLVEAVTLLEISNDCFLNGVICKFVFSNDPKKQNYFLFQTKDFKAELTVDSFGGIEFEQETTRGNVRISTTKDLLQKVRERLNCSNVFMKSPNIVVAKTWETQKEYVLI